METAQMANIFKALANEQRLNLFKMLYYWSEVTDGEFKESRCCKSIDKSFTRACECMNLSRSTISHHFKELQNAGLITCTRNGQFFTCIVNKEILEKVKKFFV